jgi:hypothetical protein
MRHRTPMMKFSDEYTMKRFMKKWTAIIGVIWGFCIWEEKNCIILKISVFCSVPVHLSKTFYKNQAVSGLSRHVLKYKVLRRISDKESNASEGLPGYDV